MKELFEMVEKLESVVKNSVTILYDIVNSGVLFYFVFPHTRNGIKTTEDGKWHIQVINSL